MKCTSPFRIQNRFGFFCFYCLGALALCFAQDIHRLPITEQTPDQTPFELLNAQAVGVVFTNSFPAKMMMEQALMNGSGVALGDYDGDGNCDIYLCNLKGANGLFRNLGQWRFDNVTDMTGTGLSESESTGAVFADIDGDGDLDLLVASLSGHHAVFMNLGDGRFVDRTTEAGLTSQWGATSMALADIDRDGDLDLYVCNYGRESVLKTGGRIRWRMVNGKPVVTGRHAERIQIINGHFVEFGQPDQLYLNDGQGRFTPVSWTEGAFRDEEDRPLSQVEWFQSLSVAFRDMNRDGWPDIYICNDGFMPDRIWMNRGDGTFRAIDYLDIRQTSYSSMGVDFADIDRDGHDDFFVADMLATDHQKRMTQRLADLLGQPEGVGVIQSRPQYRRNTLQMNRGDATYFETAFFAGLAATDWTWSVVFMDADLDGWEDLFITNGFPIDPEDKDLEERRKHIEVANRGWKGFDLEDYEPLNTPNLAFRNQRDGTFREMGREWGFHSQAISYGMAMADLDGDGDLDIVANALNHAPLIYRNTTSAPRLSVRLIGDKGNTRAIGARIQVDGGPVRQTQEVISGGRYMSGDDSIRVFAAGSAEAKLTVTVTWPDGRQSNVQSVPANTRLVLKSSDSILIPEVSPSVEETQSWFLDRTDWLNHRHQDSAYDDFQRQPSLDHKYSQQGPGLAWLDANGDGWEDLLIGTGRDGSLALFLNQSGIGFKRSEDRVFKSPVMRDLLGLLGVGGSDPYFLVTSSNYETGFQEGFPAVLQYHFKTQKLIPLLTDQFASLGPMAMADVDGDGDLDLFVGGSFMPGEIPRKTRSYLLINEGGHYKEWTLGQVVFQAASRVQACVFSDINQDGKPDLLLACDWGALRVYINKGGTFVDATEAWGLESFRGRWQSLATLDMNQDGLPDLVAGNVGLNTRASLYGNENLQGVYSGSNENKPLGVLELYDAGSGTFLPIQSLDRLETAFLELRGVFPTHKAFSLAKGEELVEVLFGDNQERVAVNTLQSMAFLNQGNRFEPVPLPVETQLSPIFGMAVADFNADGIEDIVCAQNFFANYPNLDRYASGLGLILLGKKHGGFEVLKPEKSGVRVFGEQRGVAIADFNHDARPDMVITQNGGATRLYENQYNRKGLRIRLQGGESNSHAIGASVRLVYAHGKGPLREIQGGNGFLSQNASVQVLGLEGDTDPEGIEVTWPGGGSVFYRCKPGKSEWVFRQP